MSVILSVFAGREKNIKLLKKYLDIALEKKIIDEVHFWNNTRNKEDEAFLKTISNLKRSSSTCNTYIPLRAKGDIKFNIANGIHFLVNGLYEIVLNNTRSVIHKNGVEIVSVKKPFQNENCILKVENLNLCIYISNELFISTQIDALLNTVEVKTVGSVCQFDYTPIKNNGYWFMDTCQKSWKNYYQHYTGFNDSVILKCDDDIVFIDICKLPDFIRFIKSNDYDLVFANTINNGVSAYYQQNKFNLIPKTLMDLEYPRNGLCGSLWSDGKKANQLHNYFIENVDTFLKKEYTENIPITTRFSINFFGYLGKNWHKIRNCYNDDERILTVNYVKKSNFKNILFTPFYVSHLSFYKQVETGINTEDLLKKYEMLFLQKINDLKK